MALDMKTRRHFLASAATTAALAPVAVKASARRFGEPRVLTTLRIVNTSRSEVPAGAVTQLIGCPFKKGDIPAGSWPQFQLQDGTPVAATILSSLATTWTDRSLKFVPVMLQIPVAIDAHVKVNVKVLSDGALQQGSGRSLADFTNGVSPQVQVDGLDNLHGTWVMDLGRGIAEGKKTITYGNGPAGGVWKVRARAMKGDKHHHQLVCDFYIAALSNLDGSLKGLRILGKVKLPYYDTKETMNWMSFSRFQLCASSAGPIVRDCFGRNFGEQRAYKFSWVSGPTFAANHHYSTDNYGDYGYCTRLSSTGQLPAGLFPDTSYFTWNVAATTIGFSTMSYGSGRLVTSGDGGSGKHTATPYPYLAYFGALFTAGPAGMWDFVQGAGSDPADAPLRCEIDKKYWVSTRLIPPYDVGLKPMSNNHASYWPNCSEPVTRYLSTTGERNDIGIMPSWYVRHFLTQNAVDERAVRVISLVGGQFSVGLESQRTLTYPCASNGAHNDGTPYHGMPAPNYQFRWIPGIQSQGFPDGDTTNPNVLIAGFSQQDTSHMPQFHYYPYLFTGEPWHLDMLLEHANSAVYQRYTPVGTANISETSFNLESGVRNLQVPPNAPTYADTVGGGEERSDAWASALLIAAAGICPDLNPDCKAYKQYFNDMNSLTWQAAANIYKALPPYAHQFGLWHVPSGASPFIDHWQIAYMGAAIALGTNINENKRALLALDDLVTWFDHVVAHFGGWHAGSYMTIIKSGSQSGAPIVTGDGGVAFYGPNITWAAGGHFTLTPFSNYVPANGDKFVFADSVDALGQVTPAGFAKYTPYYVINLNGSQFDLAASRGGLAIPLTDSYSGSDRFFIVAARPPGSGSMSDIGAPTSYNTEIAGMLNYARAVGASVRKETIADLAYRNQQAGLDFTSDPKWAMTSSTR